jgi:HAD superfamily hydrolase (TIGR01509 family)
LRSLEAVIFDLDGLMVDSEPLAYQAWQMVLQSIGRDLDDATYSKMVGLRLEESSSLLKQALGLPFSSSELAAKKEVYLAKICEQGIPPMPGLDEIVSAIERRSIPWGVATSSRRSYAIDILDQLDLLDSCQAIAGGDEVPKGKPSPDLYLLAAARLNMLPKACLALEDSVPGAKAALSANMTVVGVPSGQTSKTDLHFAHQVYSSLSEVATNLDSLFA